jgi:antirestriction protein ArdC
MGEQADIYERITARIIEQMETASAAGWQKPWITTGQNTLQPVNAATRREYRGVNVLILWAAAEITGYQDGRWASFKQWIAETAFQLGINTQQKGPCSNTI